MSMYRVKWEIDVEIDEEDLGEESAFTAAARKARRYQLDPLAHVGVFEVCEKQDGIPEKIDLDEMGG